MECKEGSQNVIDVDGDGVGSNNSPLLDRSKVRVLLCDNDTKSSEEIFSILCKCSYQVTSVRSARQVIDALNAEGPDIDIILSEVDLPIAKGLKMLKYITRDKTFHRIPVIMMSAKDEVSTVVKCLKLGAANYFQKPLRTNELLNLWIYMWRRRRMLGLAEKNIVNCEFVASDPSDANTSTTIFSDDTDEKSRKNSIPDINVSNHRAEESYVAASLKPPERNSLEPDKPRDTDQRIGIISSFPKKSKLKVGESSAFFTYVKSHFPTSISQRIGCMDENASQSEPSGRDGKLPSRGQQVGDDAYQHENKEVRETYFYRNGIPSSDNAVDTSSAEMTSPSILEFLQVRNSKEDSSFSLHQSSKDQVDVPGAPPLTPFPYYLPGMMNQVMMPSSPHLYQGNPRGLPKHPTSAVLPQYHQLSQGPPHVPMMPPFPYYPVQLCVQQGQLPGTHLWPSMATTSSIEVKPARLGRREAALMKFRQKRKERCFDKKIRYVNRKRLAEKRPRVRGQFVRQVNGVDVDLNGRAVTVDDSDEDDEEDEDEEELVSRDFSPEDGALGGVRFL